MKGKDWYREQEIAEEYEPKRFSGSGGSYIDQTEKKSLKRILGNLGDKEVLEVASGTGRFTELVAKEAKEIVACDISKPMLSIAKKKSRQKNIDYVKVDAENLPFKDKKFHTVFAIRFMHLVDDPKKFLEEMKRVTKKEIVFDTFSFSSFRILYNKMLPMGSRLYREKEIKNLAKKLDLEIKEEIHKFTVPFGAFRYAPEFTINTFKKLDQKLTKQQIFKNLASVNYWKLSK